MRLTSSAFFFAAVLSSPICLAGPWGDLRAPNFTSLAQTTDPTAKENILGQYVDEVNSARDDGRISYTESGRLKLTAAISMYPQDFATHELFAFIAMISEQVDRGEISKAQYEYLRLQKQNEHNAQFQARQATEQQIAEQEARARYEMEMQRLDYEAQQRAAQIQFMSDSIRRNSARQLPPVQIQTPPACSIVPDGANGWRTVCY